jgi:magnesium chelatase family protein
MPETAVRESKDRVRSALLNAHFEFPDRRITVNLAPADLPKSSGRFDLPIALGILVASGQLPGECLPNREFFGELALDGSLRPVRGLLPAILVALREGGSAVVPRGNAWSEIPLPRDRLLLAEDLLSLCACLRGRAAFPEHHPGTAEVTTAADAPDLADVMDQPAAVRALEIAASGGHNLLLYGPPGTGKSMLASRLPGLLPPLAPETALTASALADLAGISLSSSAQVPFRAPHHSASAAALVGGGSIPRPGEISLAHGGVLFLDELPEFQRHSLEMLREPLESGEITLSRARHKFTYPARFQLIAAMNPCPCGYAGDEQRHCRCTPEQLSRYRRRISGPLLDRVDLQVPVARPSPNSLLTHSSGATDSATARKRVAAAAQVQQNRQGCLNATLDGKTLLQHCGLTVEDRQWLERATRHLGLSGRALYRCLRVARTLADLANVDSVGRDQLAEALAYRQPPFHVTDTA